MSCGCQMRPLPPLTQLASVSDTLSSDAPLGSGVIAIATFAVSAVGAVSGAIVGGVASGHMPGALTGALLSSGVSATGFGAEALLRRAANREAQVAGAAALIAGVALIGLSLERAFRTRTLAKRMNYTARFRSAR